MTTCFNLWKFVRVSYSNRLLLWKKYFQKVTSQPLFTHSKSNKWSLVLMILHMFTLIAYFTVWCLYQCSLASDFWQRFCYIVLRTYLVIHLFNKYCSPGTLGKILLFNFNTNLSFFSLTTHSTILQFFILHGLVSYLIILHMIQKQIAYLTICHIVII